MNTQRLARIQEMLARRQPDLTLCLEQVHKPHNISAIIRTADAIGIHNIHAVWPDDRMRTATSSSAGSNNWVNVHTHDSIEQAVSEFTAQNMQVLATNLSDKAIDFRDIDYTKPTCIIVGQEKTGISDKALALADHHIVIPMLGMVQSLNVSVASALILYEAQRQRQIAGLYQRDYSDIDPQEQQRLLFEGGYPTLARVAKQKNLPYPSIDHDGKIHAEQAWWDSMQATRKR